MYVCVCILKIESKIIIKIIFFFERNKNETYIHTLHAYINTHTDTRVTKPERKNQRSEITNENR